MSSLDSLESNGVSFEDELGAICMVLLVAAAIYKTKRLQKSTYRSTTNLYEKELEVYHLIGH
jgi:hypothetical protein